MSIEKFLDRLAEDENPKLMESLRKLYGPLLQITLLFPSFKGNARRWTFIIAIVYAFNLISHFYLLTLSVQLLRDDFDLASLAFHYWLIFAFAMITLPMLNSYRSVIAKIHIHMAPDYEVYSTGSIYDESKPQQLEKGKRKELMQFLWLPGMVLLLAATVLVVPYLKKFNNPPHYSVRGVNMNLPIIAWYPFPTHEGFLHGLAVAGQVGAAFNMAIIIVTTELIFFRLAQAIIFEFRVLQHGVETLFKRAKKLYITKYPWLEGTPLSKRNSEYQKCFTICFKDCIKHHYKIQMMLSEFEIIIKWPAAVAYGFGTGVIGLSLINILDANKTDNYESIAMFGLLSICEVLNMFMLSVFGEQITTESEILRDELYDIQWHKLNVANRKRMLNFQVGITNPAIVKAGGLVALCMDTFSSIINTSYSFFNLMNAQ